jgi:outer membrane protein OmpA-like peptidoglycan-associated protein
MSKKYVLLLGVLLLLDGCAAPQPPKPAEVMETPKVQRLASQIKTAGIQIIQQSDKLTVIIPTDSYFEPGTAKIKEEQQSNLQAMAVFVKSFSSSFPNSAIRVTGYTDTVLTLRTQLTLSQNYAEAISAYLFNAGIEPRLIATQGRGSNEPIAELYGPHSAALNRRVVIQIN